MWIRAVTTALALIAVTAGAAMAETRHVTGSVTYRERIALPPGAMLTVSLLDVSLQDVAAQPVSSDQIEMNGVPVDFSLPYDPADISETRSYSVQARITLDGKLLFISMSHNPVLTRGAGEHVDIVVGKAAASQTSILGTDWTVEEIGDQPVTLQRPPTIRFGSDGSIAVFGGCNQFTGAFDADSGTLTLSKTLAGTLMACPEAIAAVEHHLIDLIGQATRYESNGSRLTLSTENGVALVRAKSGI